VDEIVAVAAAMRALAVPFAGRTRGTCLIRGAGRGGERNVSMVDHRRPDRGGLRLRRGQIRQPLGTSCRLGRRPLGACARGSTCALDVRFAHCIAEAGFGFSIAPTHHQATLYRRPCYGATCAVRTIFTLLGP